MPIRVYKYGLLGPTQNKAEVYQQMEASRRYRNTLVEIERGRRAALREANSGHGGIAELEKVVRKAKEDEEAAVTLLRAERSAGRTRKASELTVARVKAAKEVKKTALAALKEERRLLREDTQLSARVEEINALAHELCLSARAHCDTYWGSYLNVEDAMEASKKQPLYDGNDPNDPHFVRFGQGVRHIGVQLQGGLSVEGLFGNDRRVRVAPVDEKAWYSETRGERRRLSRTTLQIRIGSEGRDPVWATFPMIMHRPIPEGSILRRVNVSCFKIGPRERWTTEITAEIPEANPNVVRCGEGAVAIDIGWRVIGDEIRVCALEGEDGFVDEFRLSTDLLGALRKANELRSVRDMNFDKARKKLVNWYQLRGKKNGDSKTFAPSWLQEQMKTLHSWKSPGRLAALTRYWKVNRFEGDETAYTELEAWRYHEYHLWTWETSQRTKSLKRRREVYRIFAAEMAIRYKTLVLEDFDLREMAKRPKAGDDEKSENETARSNRQLVALSELRLVLENAFKGRGGEVVRVSAVDSTRTCRVCGLVETFDAAKHLDKLCTGCNTVCDQDEQASTNLLRRFQSGGALPPKQPKKKPGGGSDGSPAPEGETRWERAARLAKEKRIKKAVAAE